MRNTFLPFVMLGALGLVACRAQAPEPAPVGPVAAPELAALADPAVVDAVLRDAAREDDADTVRSLVRRKITVDRDLGGGRTALTLAAYHRSATVVTALLEAGASARPAHEGDMGPLTHAAFSGDPAIVSALVRAGADPNEKNRFGQTPLMFAALFGRDEAYAALVREGADEGARDKLGQTPKSLRAHRGDAKAAEAFLRSASREIAAFASAHAPVPASARTY